jgi:hypothetical protein
MAIPHMAGQPTTICRRRGFLNVNQTPLPRLAIQPEAVLVR